MRNEDFEQFAEILSSVSEVYGKAITAAAVKVWWAAFKPYELDAFSRAMSLHVTSTDNSGSFMPKPADLIRLMEGGTADQAQIAWAKVDRAVRVVGTYRSVAFDDPLIHAVVTEMGGWVKFGTKTEDEWPFVAKEFESRYAAHKRQKSLPPYPPQLSGSVRIENAARGFEDDSQVTLIGDNDAARRVMQGGKTVAAVRITHNPDEPLRLQ